MRSRHSVYLLYWCVIICSFVPVKQVNQVPEQYLSGWFWVDMPASVPFDKIIGSIIFSYGQHATSNDMASAFKVLSLLALLVRQYLYSCTSKARRRTIWLRHAEAISLLSKQVKVLSLLVLLVKKVHRLTQIRHSRCSSSSASSKSSELSVFPGSSTRSRR